MGLLNIKNQFLTKLVFLLRFVNSYYNDIAMPHKVFFSIF